MIKPRRLSAQLVMAGLAVIVALGVLWVAVGGYFLVQRNRAAESRMLADQIEFDVLQARRREKDFLLRDVHSVEFHEQTVESGTELSTKHLQQHEAALKSLDEHLEELGSRSGDEELSRLSNNVRDYGERFAEIVAAYHQRGFKDWGLVGRWREAAHAIEQHAADTPRLQIALLELRRAEKDYLLRVGDSEGAVRGAIVELRGAIEKEPDGQETLQAALDDYEQAFDGHITIQQTIGLTEDDGLRGRMRVAAHAIESGAFNLAGRGASAEVDTERSLVVANAAILLLGIGLAGVVFHLVARTIVRPLQELRAAAVQLGRGELDARVDVREENEVGDLARAMNQMAAQLQTSRENESTLSQQHREAEETLRDSEAVYQSLVESLPLAVFRKDREYRLIFGNKLFCDALHKSVDEFQGKTDFDLFPQELAEKYRNDDIKILEAGEVFEDLEEISQADGTRRDIHVLKGPIRDADGHIVGIQGMFWDVTEHKEALRASEARYRELFENANDLVYTSDLEGRFTSLNKSGEEITGYAREELVGQNMSLLVAPEDLEKAREMTRRKMESSERTTYQVEIVAKDGRRIPVEVGSRLIFENEKPVAIQGIVRDITERKRAEQQLHAAKEAADAAKEAADAANLAKSEFLANMSHEIRTPMNGIIGMSELLTDTELGHEQRDYVGMIQQSAGSLLGLLNDILDFSKIEAGKLELDPIPFNLSDSVGKTMHTLASRAAEKGLELACRIPPELPERLIGDPGRLRQIIVNLVGNAIKFTERGEVVVEVESQSQTDGDVSLHFSVRDTGIGIPEKKQQLIFEAFSQADTSTTRRFGGTGLGLAISTQLVRMMGGEIWVESQVGRGTTFHFTAGFKISQDQPSRSRFQLASLQALPTLVVDDNATNRRILQEMTKSWSLAPTVTDGGVAALAEMQRAASEGRPYRLILLDCMMPGMDGFSLAELIRGNDALEHPAMIMISSATRPGDSDRCRRLGIVRHMTKPVIKSELFDAIVIALDENADEAETPEAEIPDYDGPSLHILLVEDGMVNRVVATAFLEKAGHKVSIAYNGREAVDVTANQEFDLVIMDVQMPVMDGHEATALIRQREQETGGHLKIIAMTAAAMKGDREECLASGMDAYVSKPIDTEELFRTIAEQTDSPPLSAG